jgi:Fe-S cluster assembly iron-binding protein IscA
MTSRDMVNVTESARQELKKILLDNVDMPQARLRLVNREEGELGLGIDIEMPGDELVEYDGMAVLVVEKELANNLDGVTIDVDETPEGSELVIYQK